MQRKIPNLSEVSGGKKRFWMLLPVWGVIVFIISYVVATFLYPGGSQVDKNSIGFSWINNYWCNMLNIHAINGQYNPARPVAITAMIILCITLAFFWYMFPLQTGFQKYSRLVIQLSGAISMAIAIFLFTSQHDIVINVASLFGLIALTGTFIGLYKIRSFQLFWFGILNVLLGALNNYVYYTKGLIIYLPVIQKVSFAFFLVWLCCVNIFLYRKNDTALGEVS